MFLPLCNWPAGQSTHSGEAPLTVMTLSDSAGALPFAMHWEAFVVRMKASQVMYNSQAHRSGGGRGMINWGRACFLAALGLPNWPVQLQHPASEVSSPQLEEDQA